jgi:hypothetical protein
MPMRRAGCLRPVRSEHGRTAARKLRGCRSERLLHQDRIDSTTQLEADGGRSPDRLEILLPVAGDRAGISLLPMTAIICRHGLAS